MNRGRGREELSRVVASSLVSAGVTRVFGVPGTQSVDLLQAFRLEGLPFTLAAHEGGAAFMANGYARAGGGVGVLSTIGGPGFTNALTGIAEARHDSVPLLHLVSVAKGSGRAFPLQGTDHKGIAASLVKESFVASEGAEVAGLVAHALDVARSDEPGPVLIEIGADADDPSARKTPPVEARAPTPDEWGRLTGRWMESERPLFFVGQGCLGSSPALESLCTRLRVPLLTTPSARGIIVESHPSVLGFDPLKGGLSDLNALLARADLIVAVGCKLTHNGTAGFGMVLPESTLVHIDTSEAVLEANYPASISIVTSAEALFAHLEAHPRGASAWPADEIAEARARIRKPDAFPMEPRVGSGPGRSMAEFFEWLRGALPPNAIVVTDSGQHQIVTRRHLEVDAPRGLLIPSDFQSMGFGVPAAIGARHASQRPVVVVTGDGGFLMAGMELTTAVRDRLPLLCVVFADGYLNQIRLNHLSESGHAVGVEQGPFSFEGFAATAGLDYLRFGKDLAADEVEAAFRRDRPTILEVPVTDAPGLAGAARKARAKDWTREALGPERIDRLKGWLNLVRR